MTRPAPPAVSAPPPLLEVESAWLEDPPRSKARFEKARTESSSFDPSAKPRLVEWLDPGGAAPAAVAGWDEAIEAGAPFRASGPLRIEYTLDEALTEKVWRIMRKGRVDRGQVIVIDPRTGRLLAYVSADEEGLPANRAYPSASIVKVLTAAAMLEVDPDQSDSTCVYRGNKYRVNRRRLDRPSSGRESDLEAALATSNNQCFSQWAVHVLGEEKLRSTLRRFGWLNPPAPGHEAGRAEAVETRLDLGRLGSGLDGVRVTPLHVAALTSVLTGGRWIEPWWVDRVVDSHGRSLALPERADSREVISSEIADRLRTMLVSTTKRGTAKSAFRTRRGRPLVPGIEIAGKTGNLSGRDPSGRYEWFMGVAPAKNPTIGVVVLQLQGHLWWAKSSELAANVFKATFCEGKRCDAELASRFTGDLPGFEGPMLISDLDALDALESEPPPAAPAP
ncbi:MAG: penicillin-binding transpeptidase domain-containing protein [Myxococcota bacterium]